MNNVLLVGRVSIEPELRFVAGSGKAVAGFSIAVNRDFSKEKKADFFRVKVWGKQAESVANYVFKGQLVAVRGSIQTGDYENKEGNKVYYTEIIADRVEFLEWKPKEETDKEEQTEFDKFEDVTDEEFEPF